MLESTERDSLLLPDHTNANDQGTYRYNLSEEGPTLTWKDKFFQGDKDIIAVFDFDYDLIEDFEVKTQWVGMLCCLVPFGILATVCACHPCYLKRRVKWDVRAQHLAICHDGIRFVRDERKTLCGLACTDAGRETKTIPFDKITDCDILEPAGNTCLCVRNVLTKVTVDTASSGSSGDNVVTHDLTLHGLKNPHAFKNMVLAMKRNNGVAPAALASSHTWSVTPQVITERTSKVDEGGGSVKSGRVAYVPELLQEIRDDLRDLTIFLKSKQEKG